ncbi:MAG: carboxypeptidase-like regulatory domain-containing protein [Pyrinomonadaceae bacterium]|nr:carboxypeptidase-like regulatory domain-containing protein [Pyrinomonadaceae bacterium]
MTISKRLFSSFNFGLSLFFAALFFVVPAAAQTSTGVLQGIVTDENEAIIPEAKLVLRDEKGAKREIVSDANGNFSFGELAFGKYRLTVEKEGFAMFEREINLSAANQKSDLTLAPRTMTFRTTFNF